MSFPKSSIWPKKHLFSNFAHFSTPKWCTLIHCQVLKNNSNYVIFFFFYEDNIQLQIQVLPPPPVDQKKFQWFWKVRRQKKKKVLSSFCNFSTFPFTIFTPFPFFLASFFPLGQQKFLGQKSLGGTLHPAPPPPPPPRLSRLHLVHVLRGRAPQTNIEHIMSTVSKLSTLFWKASRNKLVEKLKNDITILVDQVLELLIKTIVSMF